jgi:hypothetical protein
LSRPQSRRVSLVAAQVIMLVVLQVAATVLLWVLNPLDQATTDTFALYLSSDLLAFVMISYLYRTRKYQERAYSPWLAAGYLVLITLLTSDLILA